MSEPPVTLAISFVPGKGKASSGSRRNQTYVRFFAPDALDFEQMFEILGPMRRTRVRWSRVMVLATAVALSVPTVSAVLGGPAAAGTRPRTATVRSGDTLWAIAQRCSDPGADVRSLIYEISELNGVSAGSIQPGQSLRIP
jgi:hypothetical protein